MLFLNQKWSIMLHKIQNKPVWYQLWASSVALAAVYFLVKLAFFEPTAFDRMVEAYALVSLVVDFLTDRKT
jgi:hypothetical protein